MGRGVATGTYFQGPKHVYPNFAFRGMHRRISEILAANTTKSRLQKMALQDDVLVGPMRPRHDLEMGSPAQSPISQGSAKVVSAWYYTKSVPGRMRCGLCERMQKLIFA
jgi:hypothetical protein